VRNFDKYLNESQVAWRRAHVADKRLGSQNRLTRDWILPNEVWELGLWSDIRDILSDYARSRRVEIHRGAHNLKSSWIHCANLYFPFHQPHGLDLLGGFFKRYVSAEIETVVGVELEYAEDAPLDPKTLLGEPDNGKRGANQTSPDVAFLVRTKRGKGLILTENKLSEHSFYPCSGRKREVNNPDPKRCLNWPRIRENPEGECWQMQWEQGRRKNRRYWDHLRVSNVGRNALTQCPAAISGYQLFRQQALAEGIAASGRYSLVASCVAYDARNDDLIHCLRSTGIENFTEGWDGLFDGRVHFATWTHQEWVAWVRANDSEGKWTDWLAYVERRYGYSEGEP